VAANVFAMSCSLSQTPLALDVLYNPHSKQWRTALLVTCEDVIT
jgi:hypothetical protein